MSETTTTTTSSSSNTQAYPVVLCTKDMEVLHQVSGQCWNDAFIVLIWFASGVGPYVQQALQDPELDTKFYKWLHLKQNRDNIVKNYPEVGVYYNKFVSLILDYIKKLQARFLLFLSVEGPTKIKSQIQRTLSQNYSLQMERGGIYTAEELVQQKNEPCQYVPAMGFTSGNFSNVLYIFLKFLLGPRLNLLIYHYNDTDYENYITNKDSLYFINRFTDYTIHPIECSSIWAKMDKQHKVSFKAGFIQKQGKGHSITFLTCEDGNHYIFDDNTSKMVAMNWPALFKNVDYAKSILLYIPEYTQTQTLLTLEIYALKKPAFLLITLFERQNEILINTVGFLDQDKSKMILIELNAIQSTESLINYPYKEIKKILEKEADDNFFYLESIVPLICDFGPEILKDSGLFEPLNPLLKVNQNEINKRKQRSITRKQKKNLNIRKFILDEDEASLMELLAGSNEQEDLDAAFIMAVKQGKEDIAKTILQMGANPQAEDNTAIIESVFNDNYEFADYLLSLGADITARNNFLLFTTSNKERLEYILSKGIDVHIQNELVLKNMISRGPLFCSSIKLLLQAGADWRVNDYEPIKIAIQKSIDGRLIQCLLEAISENERAEMKSIIKRELDKEMIELVEKEYVNADRLIFLLKQGADISVNDYEVVKLIKQKKSLARKGEFYRTFLSVLSKEKQADFQAEFKKQSAGFTRKNRRQKVRVKKQRTKKRALKSK